MEIITDTRTITVTNLDLLDQAEAQAIRQAEDDQGKIDQIKAEYAAQREGLVPADIHVFTVAPLDFTAQWKALAWAKKMGLWDGGGESLSTYMLGLIILLFQIQDWTGFEAAGVSLPCTSDNKVLVFGQANAVITALHYKMMMEDAADSKNFETSPAG